MNNAPLTLILIASLGIVAVISLGVFFAVRPKFADTEEHLAADVVDSGAARNAATHKPTSLAPPAPPSAAPRQNSRVHVSNNAHRPAPSGVSAPSASAPGPGASEQFTRRDGDREIVSTVEMLDQLRVASVVNGANLQEKSADPRATTPAGGSGGIVPSNVTIRELALKKELDMHSYGKIVGMAYRSKRLYVPSYQNGNVSIFGYDDMRLIAEHSCNGCHVYDVGVLANGDMILAQGKYSKLTKMNKKGRVVKEITVSYSTKGVAVSAYDEIFVLTRNHDSVYVYDSNLTQLGVVPFENTNNNDCNFVTFADDVMYVSCEYAVYALDVQGKRIRTLKPSQGAYATGIAIDESGRLFVGQRGTSVADVYDKNGKFLESVGERKDSLWSDIAVGGGYLYVIDYINASVKQYRYDK